MAVYTFGKKYQPPNPKRNVSVIKGAMPRAVPAFEKLDPMTISRFELFWEMLDTINRHGYLNASMSVIGRTAVSAGWKLRRHPEFGRKAIEAHRKRLYQFYSYSADNWRNIKDFQTLSYKLLIGAKYLKYFGFAAYEILRDKDGNALGFDFLPGFVSPNLDSKGNFLKPAFVQYPDREGEAVYFNSTNDIIYITHPSWQGYPSGGSDVESLTTYTLPLDLYLQLAAREYMKNRDKPEVVYQLPADLSQEAFDAFVNEMQARHSGAKNMGRNPIAVQGEFEVHELRDLPDKLPYQESRIAAREEELAVTGVSGAKMGITQHIEMSNLREIRREFHESTMLPLFTLIEEALYKQVHVREFKYRDWQFSFNSPDFLNAVERATVHMRYRQMGVMSPNEVREELGMSMRTDEYGDLYEGMETDEEEEESDDSNGEQGSPPEGREESPDSPGNVGEPTMDDQDPPRGDTHDTERRMIESELRNWQKFMINRIRAGKLNRRFVNNVVPGELADVIHRELSNAKTENDVRKIFAEIFSFIEDGE